MALEGEKLMTKTLQLADIARNKLAVISHLSILEPLDHSGFTYLDRTRLTVNVTQLGLTGFEADAILRQQLGVTAELPLPRHLTFIISLGNTTEDIDKLLQAFTLLSQSPHSPVSPSPHLPVPPSPHSPVSPREAFFAPTITLPVEQTPNRICAELICPYPPGIPVLMPGEAIAPEAIDYLRQVLALGGTITGCSDPTLKTLKVIR
jgi:arginine/lysine/ornithine decarboxylase